MSSRTAFHPPLPQRAAFPPARGQMGRAKCSAAMPPRRVGAVAKDVQQALQVALRERMSRMEIRLPRGARLGTERRSSEEETDSEAGDREVGRILAGMFEKTGLSVCVVFDSERARRRAEKMWGPVAECETAAWECSKGRKKGKTRKSGFGRDDGKTKDFDVYIVVGGGAGFVARVREVAQRVGMDTLVILANVNARNEVMPVDLQKYREANFKWVYFYQPDPHPQVRGGVLFRKFPDDWVLCRMTAVGMLQTLLVQRDMPDLETIKKALGVAAEGTDNVIMNKMRSMFDLFT